MTDLPTLKRKVRHIAGTFERIDGTLVIAFDVPEHLYSDGLIKASTHGLVDDAALAFANTHVVKYLNMYLRCKTKRLVDEGCQVIAADFNIEPMLSVPGFKTPMVRIASGEQQERKVVQFEGWVAA